MTSDKDSTVLSEVFMEKVTLHPEFNTRFGLNIYKERRTIQPMEPASKEYVDLKLQAALAPINAKLEVIRDNQISPWQVWGAALTGFGAVLAVLAFGGDQFGLGSSLADQRQQQLQRDQAQEEKLDAMLSRLDALLAAQATQDPTTAPLD